VSSVSDAARIAVPARGFWTEHVGDALKAAEREAGDRVALIGDCDSATLAWYVEFRGMEQAMMDLFDAPRMVHAVMERGVEYAVERGKFFIDNGLKILRLNDSVANMSVISPAMWREFILPHMCTVCTELHRYSEHARIYCHICGNVLPIIDCLLETGLDCIGPLDPLGGFSVADARAAAGAKMVLMGGVNTLDFVNATPGQLCESARGCIRDGQVDGSCYILGSGCVVPPGASLDNLHALARASRKGALKAACPPEATPRGPASGGCQ
jgi:uroporphyrinogen-III decarboxylase